MAKFDLCTGRRGAFGGTSEAAVAAMATIAERRMLGFVGELLRVRRTRLSPSFGGFAALRPAFLRLKALTCALAFAVHALRLPMNGWPRWGGRGVLDL